MFKKITNSKQTREGLLAGALTLAEVVGSTLGPMGQNVVIETPYGATTVTKDGVTVAKFIDLEDPVENLGAQLIKQAAARTAHQAGDGTTTATVIAAALAKEANKLITAGVPPIAIKRRIDVLLQRTLEDLTAISSKVDDSKIQQVATIAANNDEELGALIAQAYKHVGSEGLITLEDSKSGETYLGLSEGVAVDKGYSSLHFITDARKEEAVLENPMIFITDQKLRYQQEIVPILELASAQRRPLLIIADEIEGQALALCVVNHTRRIMQIATISAPGFGENRIEALRDLAALTSSKIISKSDASRIEDTTPLDFGSAQKVIISKDKTVFIQPTKDEVLVAERVEALRAQLPTETNDYLRNKLQRRLADLTASVAVLYVGAPTESELIEKKHRVDDSLRATSCALQKGYVIGGGAALAGLSKDVLISDQLIDPIFVKALQAPLLLIASNAGAPSEVILNTVLNATEPNVGFNAKTLQFSNLIEDGVIDPTLVVEQALINAVSAASMIILSSSSITNGDRKPPFSPGDLSDYAA